MRKGRDEFIVGQQAHNYKYEGGGAAIFGGIQPQPIDQNKDGSIDIEKIQAYIKPLNDYHFTNTKLISQESVISYNKLLIGKIVWKL